jgi:tetratricopeptide (TPR) repeat protein
MRILALCMALGAVATGQTWEAWVDVAVARESEGDFLHAERAYRHAERAYRKALAAATGDERLTAKAMLAALLLRQGRAEACEHLPELRGHAVDLVRLVILAGLEKSCRGPRHAIPHFQRALAMAEGALAPRIAMNLCLAQVEAGDFEGAARTWEEWRVFASDSRPVGDVAYALALAETGETGKALDVLRPALSAAEVMPLTPEERAHLLRIAARVHRKAGLRREAKALDAEARRQTAALAATVHVTELNPRKP